RIVYLLRIKRLHKISSIDGAGLGDDERLDEGVGEVLDVEDLAAGLAEQTAGLGRRTLQAGEVDLDRLGLILHGLLGALGDGSLGEAQTVRILDHARLLDDLNGLVVLLVLLLLLLLLL
ncbi:hypothetical protein PMAYCL1PPCAC_32808, partial [Pristionchus mayeri]